MGASALSNETAGDAEARLALFKHFHDQEVETAQIESTTKNLGSGSAQLFLTPQDSTCASTRGARRPSRSPPRSSRRVLVGDRLCRFQRRMLRTCDRSRCILWFGGSLRTTSERRSWTSWASSSPQRTSA